MSTELPEIDPSPARIRSRNGIKVVGVAAGGQFVTEPTYGEYVLAANYDALLARIRALDELWDEYTDILAESPGEGRDTMLLATGARLDELRDRLRKEGVLE